MKHKMQQMYTVKLTQTCVMCLTNVDVIYFSVRTQLMDNLRVVERTKLLLEVNSIFSIITKRPIKSIKKY